jgi:uncharacterized protein YbjT (DUF2867 family)
MSRKLAVVVTGGTGKQGGAVVKSLLERGHEVRAVTRSTDSAKARELANADVTLVRASLEDTAALTKALEGATSLFAITTPFEGGPDTYGLGRRPALREPYRPVGGLELVCLAQGRVILAGSTFRRLKMRSDLCKGRR